MARGENIYDGSGVRMHNNIELDRRMKQKRVAEGLLLCIGEHLDGDELPTILTNL